ncbi:MAG: hypothetical protein ACM3XO_12290 [Bacteroidota bacterium]
MKNTILLILACLLLAGCTAQAAKPVVPEGNTQSSTATESPRPTLTPPATSTQAPSQTPDPVLATRQAALASCRGNSQENIDRYIDRGYSATRFWSATVCQDDGVYTKVAGLGKDKFYKIPALDTDARTTGPDWFWEPYLWSVDGDYLYLTSRYLGSIDAGGSGLMQLDLSTGERNVLLKPRLEGYDFALSEDGRLFAFLTDIPRTIDILDVKTKEKHQLSFKERYKILEMRWTPDGARLIILTEESAADPAPGGFSIFEYSLESDNLTKLVDKNNLNSLYSSDASAAPRVYISDLTNDILSLSDKLQQSNFEVDLRRGDVIQIHNPGTPEATP